MTLGEDKGMPARGLKELGRNVACNAIAFHVLSWYIEDTASEYSCIAKVEDDSGICTILVHDPNGCTIETLDFISDKLPKVFNTPTLNFKCRCSSEPYECMGFEQLSRNVAAAAVKLLSEIVRLVYNANNEYIKEGNRELFIIVGWSGEPAYGFGGENSITLPGFSAPLMIHTHPSPVCYPSARDLESSAAFFSLGGIASLIASKSCIFIMRLSKPLIEEDYWQLIDAAKCVRKAKDYELYNECIMTLSKLKSLIFEVEAFPL